MTGYTGGLWRGPQAPSPPPTVLGEAKYGVAGRRELRSTLLRRERDYPGQPLSPTIFNVVVDAVVCHWESLLVAEWEEQEGGEIRGD